MAGAGDDAAVIEQILKEPESNRFETKRLAGKNDKKVETIVAFANSNGGWLILGVEDADKAQGRDRLYGIEENSEALDELKRLVRQRFTPPIAPPDAVLPVFIPISTVLRDGKPGTIVAVRVEPSGQVHSLVNGGTFVRMDRSNREISAAEITELSLRRGVISFVAQPVDVAIELLNTDHFRGYAAARKLTRPFPECLEHVGLTKRGADGALRPTRAAVLLFAEDPAGVLNEKCAIRLFHYKGDSIEHNERTNLLRHATTIRGPLVTQIRDAVSAVVDSLAAGLQMGPLGFEVAQKYPVRVLREAITNAVIHRDYFTPGDIHIRIFGNRIEVESPGRFPHAITPANIRSRGSQPRNRQIVDHLRDFPNPPNLDAGEGVPMMVELMDKSSLYPPIYLGHSELGREAVAVVLINEAMPTVWKQIEAYLEKNDTIGNAEVRALLKKPDTLAASKLIRSWVDSGLLILSDPTAAKKFRRYRRPGLRTDLSFHFLRDKKMNSPDTK